MKSVIPLLVTSLLIAIASAAQPLFIRRPDNAIAMHLRVFGPAALWLILLAAALVRYGTRGLWLLVGAPFALFGPTVWSMYVLGCTLGEAPC